MIKTNFKTHEKHITIRKMKITEQIVRSRVQPFLTLDYIQTEHENKWFDVKSALIRPSDLSPLISAFANAEGGTIVIGVNDKTRAIEGVNGCSEKKISDFISAAKDCCKPMPKCKEEFLEVKNQKGVDDRLLLLHIDTCPEQVIRTTSDSTYLRIGDKTKELKGEDLRNLEYSKGFRNFEEECTMDATMDDLDQGLLSMYQTILHAEKDTFEQILSARGLIRNIKGEKRLTNAAVLLFAKNIQQFYPNCRVRFIRYDGTYPKTGTNMNITKDVSIELPILKIIDKAKEFIGSQLRQFVALDSKTGKFNEVPEYPEFAWQEGVVNAITHREYALAGGYIKVSMYDDRLEIESPGRLPNIVTVENIRETRYSRNPRIARVLNDFGWVRELNEGVKRIYEDMKMFFLEDPVYSEPEQSVRLILKNNFVVRNLRRQDRIMEFVGEDQWWKLEELDRRILVYMSNNKTVNRLSLEKYTGKSGRTINERLKRMVKQKLIKRNGSIHDPKLTYSIITNEF